MKRQQKNPIDPMKLRCEIFKRKLSLAEVSESLGYNKNQMSCVLSQGIISKPVMKGLEREYGIKYEAYKPEEKKEEPVKEKPKPETEVISKDEAQLKTIITQLSALNNAITMIYRKLEDIDSDIKVWEVADGD